MKMWIRVFEWFRPPVKKLPRERFMLPKEWEWVRPTLETCPAKVRIYFSILFLEGCRMSELRNMRWMDLDVPAKLWRITKAKNGKQRMVALSDCTCELLAQVPQDGIYVFWGDLDKGGNPSKPWSRTAVWYWWRNIRHKAGCHDLRIHDLRRSTGSWMTIAGENLIAVKDTLGHTDIAVTAKHYAHLDVQAQRDAKNRHAERVFPK